MPTNTKQSIIAAAGINERSLFDFALVARLVRAIEGRISPLEAQRESLEGAINAVQRVGLSRINEVLGPAIESVLRIQERGFLIARSSTSATLGSGNILSFFVDDIDERALFTPSPFVALTREDNTIDYAVARTIAYDQSNGEFLCEVLSFEGAPGPHSDWVIGALAGSTVAQIAMLADARDAADEAIAATNSLLTAVDAATDAATAAQTSAGEAAGHAGAASGSAGAGAGFAQAAEDAAEAAQTFDPASFYQRTEIDPLLDAKQDASEKGAANGYAPLDGDGLVPSENLPDPALPDFGDLSIRNRATVAQHRSLSGDAALMADRLRDAAALIAPSGAANWTPDWSAFVSADWRLEGNRTMFNPINVIPGTTRVVKIHAISWAGLSYASWGSNFKGNLPTVPVSNSAFLFVTLTAITATEIVVSHLEYTP